MGSFPSNNSSEEEDEDPRWRAAIESIAAASDFSVSSNAPTKAVSTPIQSGAAEGEDNKPKSQALKLYQIKQSREGVLMELKLFKPHCMVLSSLLDKAAGRESGWRTMAQKLLDDLLDKSLEMVNTHAPAFDESAQRNGGGIRLFSQAPPGIVFDPIDVYQRPTKRPRILPTEEINEKSKKFRRQVQSVVVDGTAVIASAEDARQRSLARFEAKEAAAKAAAKREEERVAELKRIRGEKWLPSIARDMQALVKKATRH